jgi:hypothetical protein
VTKIGVTGHQGLTPGTERLIADAITQQLDGVTDLVGITSLAEGADQVFAERVIAAGGTLTVILPAADYARTFPAGKPRQHYEELLSRATQVVRLLYETSSEEAYWAAGQEVVERSDRLLAVWNGRRGGGLGGTADVVAYAHECGRPTVVIWPPGSKRLSD